MRRGAYALVAWLVSGCGAAPPAPSPVVARVAAAQAPAPAHVLVLSSADGYQAGYRYLHFDRAGRLVAQSALGLHRIDPKTGAEQLFYRLSPQDVVDSLVYAGPMAALRVRDATRGASVVVIDVESGRRLPLPEGAAAQVTLSPDGSRAVWIDTRDGHGVVLDTESGKTLYELAKTQPGPGDAKFASSGRYLMAGGALRDLQSGAEILRLPSSALHRPDGIGFVSIDGREGLVFGQPTLLTWFEPDTRRSALADIDCLKSERGYREATLPALDVYVRLCPRGAIAVDLRKLASHTGKKPLAPLRVKDAYSFRPDTGALLLGLRPKPSANAYGAFDGEYMARWQHVDPRTGASTPVPSPAPSIVQSAGAYAIELSAHDARCTLRGAALAAAHDLCSASLSNDGGYLATASNGALTIAALPSLETVYAAGDSLTRSDESLSVSVSVEDGVIAVQAHSYSARSAENEFQITHDERLRPLEFSASADDFSGVAVDDARKVALLAAVDPQVRDDCKQIGLLDHGKIGLLRCATHETETFVRYDPTTLAPLSSPRSGRPPGRAALGSVGGFALEADMRTPALQIVQVRDEASKEILAHMHVGWDFAIVTDSNEHVQLFGNRKRAATWLRCLDAAREPAQLTPFETCAARVEARLF